MIFYLGGFHSLIECDVGDDLCVDVLIESSHECLTAHHQFLLEDRRADLHIESLVFDEDVASIAQDSLSHHIAPRIDEAVLIEGRFQSFFS